MNRPPDAVVGAAPAPPVAAPEPVLLFDDGQTRIDHYGAPSATPSAPGDATATVVITFDPLLYLWPKPPFGLDFLRRQGTSVIAVRRKSENFYQPLDRDTFMQAVAPLLGRYTRVIAYGSSLGAYAALYFGRDLDCTVVAASPRVSTHPRFGAKAWQDQVPFLHQVFDAAQPARCQAIVIYDPREATDRRYVEGEVLPQFPRAQVMRVPFAGHPATQFLGDIGFLPGFIRAIVAGRPPPPLDRRRRRVQSGTYFQVLAALCAERGRLATASALVDRAVTLRPKNMLAHRTRGLVCTLQRDWPGAVVALETALAFDPADRLTVAMLDRARRGRSALAIEALQAALPAPAGDTVALPAVPLWQRVWGRLRQRLSGR